MILFNSLDRAIAHMAVADYGIEWVLARAHLFRAVKQLLRVTVTRNTDALWNLLSHAVTAPGRLRCHRDIRFRYYEIICRDIHLSMCGYWLLSVDRALDQEMLQRSDQVLNEVKIVVVHIRRHCEWAWTSASVVEGLRVLDGYQVVFHTVDEECRAFDFTDFVEIVEPLFEEIFQHATRLIFSNWLDWLERWHHYKATGVVGAGQVSRRSGSHRSAEYNHVFLFNA